MEDSPIRNLYYCKEGGMQNVEGTEKYNYLVEKANEYEKKIEEILKDNAEVCKLYKAYKKILDNDKLVSRLKEYGYTLCLKLHPEMEHFKNTFSVPHREKKIIFIGISTSHPCV